MGKSFGLLISLSARFELFILTSGREILIVVFKLSLLITISLILSSCKVSMELKELRIQKNNLGVALKLTFCLHCISLYCIRLHCIKFPCYCRLTHLFMNYRICRMYAMLCT